MLLMFFMLKKKKIYAACVSKHNSNSEKQVILLMILNGEGCHYLAVKNYQHYYGEQRLNTMAIFIVWNAFTFL